MGISTTIRRAMVLLAGAAIAVVSIGALPGTAMASVPDAVLKPAATTVAAKAVTAGFVHTCALTTKGAVKCWGYNGEGELGDNTTVTSATPVGVYGLGKGVKAIGAGSYFACALTTKGGVKCWGSNTYGQLGNGTTVNSAKPVAVQGLGKNVKAMSVGNYFACALTTKGAVKCWGANTYGQLGNNSTVNSGTPVGVFGLGKGVKALGAGGYHACAVTTKGGVKCWGYNGDGELGDNTTVSSVKPVSVYGLSKNVKTVAGGNYSTCAVTTTGAVKCWGYNGDGELGDNTTVSSVKPVPVYGLGKKVKAVTVGDIHGCALTTSGAVKCWGYNGYGALGDNTTASSAKPVGLYDLNAKIKDIAAGGYHSCAVTTKGSVKCWGFNAYGQLGNNTTLTSHKPVGVVGIR